MEDMPAWESCPSCNLNVLQGAPSFDTPTPWGSAVALQEGTCVDVAWEQQCRTACCLLCLAPRAHSMLLLR